MLSSSGGGDHNALELLFVPSLSDWPSQDASGPGDIPALGGHQVIVREIVVTEEHSWEHPRAHVPFDIVLWSLRRLRVHDAFSKANQLVAEVASSYAPPCCLAVFSDLESIEQ